MGAQMRVYRQRIRAVQATKKITRAMELIAASRVVKARQRVHDHTPYARALTQAVSAVATFSNVDHPALAHRFCLTMRICSTSASGSGAASS